MFRLLPAFTLALFLATGWWPVVELISAEQPTPTTDSACSMDPWGCPRG